MQLKCKALFIHNKYYYGTLSVLGPGTCMVTVKQSNR